MYLAEIWRWETTIIHQQGMIYEQKLEALVLKYKWSIS